MWLCSIQLVAKSGIQIEKQGGEMKREAKFKNLWG
jgi:hypothetical protein